jgi:hypothetical protein
MGCLNAGGSIPPDRLFSKLYLGSIMAQVILLCSMGGDNFHCSAGDMAIVNDDQKQQWIDGGVARDLLSTEPTELQTATAKDFSPAPNKSEQTQPEKVAEQTPQPKPSKRKKPDAV